MIEIAADALMSNIILGLERKRSNAAIRLAVLLFLIPFVVAFMP